MASGLGPDEVEGRGSSSKRKLDEESQVKKRKLMAAEESVFAARAAQREAKAACAQAQRASAAAQKSAQAAVEALVAADESLAAAKKGVAEVRAVAVDEGDAAEAVQEESRVAAVAESKAPVASEPRDQVGDNVVAGDHGSRLWDYFGEMPSNGNEAKVGDIYSGFGEYRPNLPQGAVWVPYKVQGRWKAVWITTDW